MAGFHYDSSGITHNNWFIFIFPGSGDYVLTVESGDGENRLLLRAGPPTATTAS